MFPTFFFFTRAGYKSAADTLISLSLDANPSRDSWPKVGARLFRNKGEGEGLRCVESLKEIVARDRATTYACRAFYSLFADSLGIPVDAG